MHDSGHPEWIATVDEALQAIPQKLRDEGLVEGTSNYNRAAKKAFEDISDGLRRDMLRLGRMTENEEASPAQDA